MKTEITINGEVYQISETEEFKKVKGPSFCSVFNKHTGMFARWGKTLVDDPKFCPIGPEILDLEISVNGCPQIKSEDGKTSSNCKFCYKSNTSGPATNMTLDQFKVILSKMPPVLTQIAFGITGVQTNKDFIPMMQHARKKGVIPNFTLSGADLTKKLAKKISKIVGALAVSAYESNKDLCYNTVKTFTDLGVDQSNIHVMISEQSYDFARELLVDRLTDPRLKHMNAVVFLSVKPKGRAKNNFTSLSQEKFNGLAQFCLDKEIPFGFDSCSASKFEAFVAQSDIKSAKKEMMLQNSESCESFGLFSSYINASGEYFPCSFCEGEEGWETGLSVLDCNDFLADIWYGKKLSEWRLRSLNQFCTPSGCRLCPIFPEVNAK